MYFSRLIVSLASPKVLTLDNKNKSSFYFVLSSLIRIFARYFNLVKLTNL
jgi:hypothetical protein